MLLDCCKTFSLFTSPHVSLLTKIPLNVSIVQLSHFSRKMSSDKGIKEDVMSSSKNRSEADVTPIANSFSKPQVSGSSSEDLSSDEKGKSAENKPVTRKSLKQMQRNEEIFKEREKFLSLPLENKRELYKCNKFITLQNIETWPDHFIRNVKEKPGMKKWWQENKSQIKFEIREDLNRKLSLFQGDITTLEIDAIANAANESLLGGGGVDGAIHSAAGRNLRSECETLNGCDPGDAKITCGYKLPAKYVVHTVGPRGENAIVLERSYTKCLNLVKENNLKSIAFPCISTGIFGYPNHRAANVAINTVRTWLEKNDYAKNIDRIIFCLFLKVDIDIYDKYMQLYFPLDRGTDTSKNRASDEDDSDKAEDEESEKADKAEEPKSQKADKKSPKKNKKK